MVINSLPLPKGIYVLYDTKEHRGWWAGGGLYTIWPGKAKIYTAEEINAMRNVLDYADVYKTTDLALSCADFMHVDILTRLLQG